ncbi:hypothetical protein DVH24_023734 [Malus domestica]|uniref:Uncharacterized protein n=1 Tax=Malus domestica TaxID=3750 RepID=A0A498I2R7_MALDO|nr:hypothetical protein DVH24_023734 [Malus domestica]
MKHAMGDAYYTLVWFMGENSQSHISVEFDSIVAVVLENYGGSNKTTENLEGLKNRLTSWSTPVDDKGELNVTVEDAKNPCF